MSRLIAILASCVCSSCAVSPTFGEKVLADFNKDFGRDHPLSPTYRIEPLTDDTFLITLHQGAIMISDGSVRWELLNQAAEVVASDFCGKLGGKARADKLIKLGDSGWVHMQARFSCYGASPIPRQPPPAAKQTPV